MVHEKTISKIFFGGIGEIMMFGSAFLIGLVIIEISPNLLITVIMIFVLMFIGILLRNNAEEFLGDLISGKWKKRIPRWKK